MNTEVISLNMYKFGNYICKLREDKNLTQGELADKLDVSDKSISKWENGQAFPRIDTFEKLASALDTTIEDILSASKDGIKRICVSNNFYYVMQVDIDGQLYSIRAEESKWIEINDKTDSIVMKITGEFLNDELFSEIDSSAETLKEKILFKIFKKASTELMDIILQVDCTYKISNICDDALISIEYDGFDVGDKTLMLQDFQIMYPKVICGTDTQVELLNAKGKNSNEVIKKYKKLGLQSDLGAGFFIMLLSYPLRDMYFKHLCKPRVLKKNILNAEKYKSKREKHKGSKKFGCFSSIFAVIIGLLIWLVLDALVFSVIFVSVEKPFLVAKDYSTITYNDSVYTRIDELPSDAYPTTTFGAAVWGDSRTDGLSKWEQSSQGDKVQLFEDNEGREYLWLVEDYVDTILGAKDNGDDKEYEDFDEHYVYVCENP